jgi:hypothetical protein
MGSEIYYVSLQFKILFRIAFNLKYVPSLPLPYLLS